MLQSRLKLLNYHSPKTTLGFIPILAIKDITGDPAKNGKITIISRIKEDAKLVMENDNFATATKLLIQYQLLASKSCMPTDHDLLNDAIDAFRRPTKQGTHRIPDPSGKSNRCAIVDVGGKCVFLIYWEEHLLLLKWWVHLADQSELDRWSEEIIETVNSDTVYMEPLGKTWPLSYIDQIKLKKTKVRRLYAVKVLEDRLHCHHEKKDTRLLVDLTRVAIIPNHIFNDLKNQLIEQSTTKILKPFRFIVIEQKEPIALPLVRLFVTCCNIDVCD